MEELILKLENDPVIQAVPKLKTIVSKLKKAQIQAKKISDRNCDQISFMADGMEYDQAYKAANKANGIR